MIPSRFRSALLAFLSLAVTALVLGSGEPAQAGEAFVPTRFDDPAPNGCLPDDCSLREAIVAANTAPGLDTILLGAGTYSVSLPGPDDGQPADGDLNVNSAIRLIGDGASSTTIAGGGQGRVAFVSEGAALYLAGVTVRGGNTGVNGGGILNIGSLTVVDSVFRENTADLGGAIASGGGSGRLVVDRTTLVGNTGGGGGLFLADAGSTAAIRNSTISGNSGLVHSGGVHVQSGVNVTLTNVTISANSSPAPVAMTVTSDAVATLTNVTIADNVSTSQFKGAIANYADIIIRNTIIQDAELGCFGDGTFQSQGHNIGNDDSCSLSGPGDMPSTDPMLDPLADNGGRTLTHALQAGSPAINAGDDAGCPFTDQRGYGRAGVCDIGAFEFGGAAVTIKQGDVNCDDAVTAVDALVILRVIAQLPTTAECVNAAGDVNCDGDKTAVDALGVLRFVAGLPVNQGEPCPDIGTPV